MAEESEDPGGQFRNPGLDSRVVDACPGGQPQLSNDLSLPLGHLSIPTFLENLFDLAFEVRQVSLYRGPYLFHIHAKIVMDERISHGDDFGPRDCRVIDPQVF